MKLFISLGALVNLNTLFKHPVFATYYWAMGYSYNPKYTPALIDSACWALIWLGVFLLANIPRTALRRVLNRSFH